MAGTRAEALELLAGGSRLARVYGSHAPGASDPVARVVCVHRRERPLDADGVLRRRTTLAVRGLDEAGLRARVEALP